MQGCSQKKISGGGIKNFKGRKFLGRKIDKTINFSAKNYRVWIKIFACGADRRRKFRIWAKK